MFAIDAVWPGALTPAIRVDALVVPRITGGQSRIVPTAAAGALSALASPTLLQLPVGGESLAVMARIARTVPCFALELGPAADGAAAIADLLAGMAGVTTVSVIIPARDAEPFIAAAVTSVTTQSHPPDEVLVIDDDSADATATVAARLPGPVRVIPGRFGSAAAARNEGLRQATGQLIAFLDADDVWLPESLSARVDALEREPNADYAVGLVTAAPAPGEPWPAWAPAAWKGALLPGHLDAFLGRRDAVAAVGGLTRRLRPARTSTGSRGSRTPAHAGSSSTP